MFPFFISDVTGISEKYFKIFSNFKNKYLYQPSTFATDNTLLCDSNCCRHHDAWCTYETFLQDFLVILVILNIAILNIHILLFPSKNASFQFV